MRGRGEHREGLSGMSSGGTKDMEHQDWLGSIIAHHIKFPPSDDLWTFLTPLILIWHLNHYDSHSLEAVSQPSSIKASFHFHPNFP